MAVCEFLGVVECEHFLPRELILVGIELSNFCLGQFRGFSFCNLQKPRIQSGKAVIESGDLEANQFNERLIETVALSCWKIKGEIAFEEFWRVSQASSQRRILPGGLHCGDLLQGLWG